MIKQTLVAGALAAGLAGAGSAAAEPFDGPYVGVQAGWSQDDVGTASTAVGPVGVNGSNDSFTAGIFAG